VYKRQGYYIAVTGDPIIAYPNTLTGSIGVIFARFNLHGLFDKIGLNEQILTLSLIHISPFEDIYRDHAIYLHALLGEDLEAAIGHFKAKIVAQDDPMSAIRCSQVLVGLLVRRERYQEAMQISLEHLNLSLIHI